jgi:hypothetical protein
MQTFTARRMVWLPQFGLPMRGAVVLFCVLGISACSQVWVEERSLKIAKLDLYPKCVERGLGQGYENIKIKNLTITAQPTLVMFEVEFLLHNVTYNGLVKKYSDDSFRIDLSGKSSKPTGARLEAVRASLESLAKGVEWHCSA